MKYIGLTAVAGVLTTLTATTSLAQEGYFVDVPPSILAVLNALEDQSLVDWIEYADLDGDGSVEAVVKTMMGPDENDPDFREWRVIDDQDGMGVQVGTWYGTQIEVVTTKPKFIDDPKVSAVVSDGAFWHLFKGKMRPFADIVALRAEFIHPGTALDTEKFAEFGHQNVDPVHMARVTLDTSVLAGDEVLISLMGDGFWREEDGATPYVLMSAAGDLIHSGWSFTHPSVFKLPDGGFQLIEAVNNSYRAVYFPEGEDK
jgi:hypothetical protein